jgi:hypothetical protein
MERFYPKGIVLKAKYESLGMHLRLRMLQVLQTGDIEFCSTFEME